jgi:hypothetical protein
MLSAEVIYKSITEHWSDEVTGITTFRDKNYTCVVFTQIIALICYATWCSIHVCSTYKISTHLTIVPDPYCCVISLGKCVNERRQAFESAPQSTCTVVAPWIVKILWGKCHLKSWISLALNLCELNTTESLLDSAAWYSIEKFNAMDVQVFKWPFYQKKFFTTLEANLYVALIVHYITTIWIRKDSVMRWICVSWTKVSWTPRSRILN